MQVDSSRLAESFWASLQWSGDCLIWVGATDRDGYGQLPTVIEGPFGRTRKAHRLAYALTHGALPTKGQACHTCDNPPCCRPEHLFDCTPADNMRDMHAKGRAVVIPGWPGESNPWAKFTAEQVHYIRERYAQGVADGVGRYAQRGSPNTITALAREFDVSPSTVARLVRRDTYSVHQTKDGVADC